MKEKLKGMLLAAIIGVVMYGAHTLWGFRNDYLKLRQEHQVMYQFLAGVVGKVDGKPVARVHVLDQIINRVTAPPAPQPTK
jgi:hypothetical protein